MLLSVLWNSTTLKLNRYSEINYSDTLASNIMDTVNIVYYRGIAQRKGEIILDLRIAQFPMHPSRISGAQIDASSGNCSKREKAERVRNRVVLT